MLFGATGFTGELTARALVARGARPVLAGRSRDRVQALAEELGGLESAVADVARPESVRALVEGGDVLVATVGPFGRFGEPAVRAAVDAGAHYLDSTGETPFIRAVFERHGPAAEGAGCGLLTAFGYDFVPGNLAGALALREAGDAAVRVDTAYFWSGAASSGAMSGGTRASAAGVMLEPGLAFRGGRLVTERTGRRVRAFTLAGRDRPAMSVGGTEHFALPRIHPTLRDVGVYVGWFGPATRAVQAVGAGASLLGRVPGARAAMGAVIGRVVKGSTGGPDAAARASSRSTIVAVAADATGAPLATVRLEGVNGYDFTGEALAWGAMRAADGGLQSTGALGPVDGFGLDELEAGMAAAGLSRA